MTDTDMPETIWVFKGAKKGTIIVDTIPDLNTAYRLKSTEDKTIRELAAALKGVNGLIDSAQEILISYLIPGGIGQKEAISSLLLLLDGPEQRTAQDKAQQALTDNAPRIAEAQEDGG